MNTYKFKINGKDFDVAINSVEGKNAKVSVNGVEYDVELGSEAAPAASAPVQAASAEPGQQTASAQAAAPAAQKPAGAGKKVCSPLPGVIIEVSVKEGQTVKAGQKLAVIEAMKMENEISAESDGTVTAVHVSKGDSVLEGADIVTIA